MLQRLLFPLLVALLVAASGGLAVQTWRIHRLQLADAQRQADAAELARTTERQASARNREIDHADQARQAAQRALAAAVRADADGLRDALADARFAADATAAGCADERATSAGLARLLREAADLAAECQARGGDVARQVMGLQGYAAQVCAAQASGAWSVADGER